MKTLTELLLTELNQEIQTTRKMLERIPDDQYHYKPHAKSGTIQWLATHIADLPSWLTMTLTTVELDFEKKPYQPPTINSTSELLAYLEKNVASGQGSLAAAQDEELWLNWTLRSGDQIFSTSSKYEVIRMVFAQIIHHRAQLGVYLRLLNIPIPGSYGPSADEMNF